jgi:hypothetical protein
LTGIVELEVQSRFGTLPVFVFDAHRLALPCWWSVLGPSAGAVLFTLDRHFDLVPPSSALPARNTLREVDELARWELDARNVDHILAAMELGVLSDAVVLARSHPRGAFEGDAWTDSHGIEHRLFRAASLSELSEPAHARLAQASQVVLDIDLDCFTSLLPGSAGEVSPWTRESVRGWLGLPDRRAFWDPLLSRVAAVTLAREPAHCGGVLASGRLFEDLAPVLFQELLGAELP